MHLHSLLFQKILTLNGHHKEDGQDSHQTSIAHFDDQQVPDNDGKQWGCPHGVNEHWHQIESIHIVAQQIDNFTGCGVAERILRQLGCFPVNDTAHRDPDSHSRAETLVHELIHVEGTEQTDANDSASRQPSILLGQGGVVLAEELQQFAQQKWLDEAKDLADDGDDSEYRILPPECEYDGLD